jgi:hypothetical protein
MSLFCIAKKEFYKLNYLGQNKIPFKPGEYLKKDTAQMVVG